MGIGLDLAYDYKIADVVMYDGFNSDTRKGWLALNEEGNNVLFFDKPFTGYHHPFGIDKVFNCRDSLISDIVEFSGFKEVKWHLFTVGFYTPQNLKVLRRDLYPMTHKEAMTFISKHSTLANMFIIPLDCPVMKSTKYPHDLVKE